MPLYLKNGHVLQKLFFAVILENTFFFLKKLFNEKYLKPHFLQKKLYWFLSLDAPSPQNDQVLPQMDFHNFF